MVSTREYDRLKEELERVQKENEDLKSKLENLCAKCKRMINGEKVSILNFFRR